MKNTIPASKKPFNTKTALPNQSIHMNANEFPPSSTSINQFAQGTKYYAGSKMYSKIMKVEIIESGCC